MVPDGRGERIQQLFVEAARLPVDDRDEWLRGQCDGDDQLLGDLRSLLKYDNLPNDPLELGPTFPEGLLSPSAGGEAEPPVVPGYRIVRTIGTGGQAIVFEAIQETTTQRVALKVLRRGKIASSQERERLRREVLILARLSHPGIVSIIDCGETASGVFFIATKFVNGPRLDHLYETTSSEAKSSKTNTRDEYRARVLRLFVKICDAVDAAHRSGVVHRDLKPANILLDEHGEPCVLDFGLAKPSIQQWLDEVAVKDITISGEFMGSLPWASPEQAAGEDVDARSDVYSLGVILYQLVSGGQFPYDVSGSMRDVITKIMHADPTPLVQPVRDPGQCPSSSRATVPLVDEGLNAIVLKSLAKSRDDRYQTAGEFAKGIGEYLVDNRDDGPVNMAAKGRSSRSVLVGIAFGIAILAVMLGVLRPFSSAVDRHDHESALTSTTIAVNGLDWKSFDWKSFDWELSKLSDNDSITRTADGWRIRGGEVRFLELSSGVLVLRAVLRRYSDDPFALRLQSRDGSEINVEVSHNGDSDADVVSLRVSGENVEGKREHFTGIGRSVEVLIALLSDRVALAYDGRLTMQLHCQTNAGPWTPVLDATSADIDCVDLQYSQPAMAPLAFAVDVVPAEMAAVEYVVQHRGAAFSQLLSHSNEQPKFHVTSLTMASEGDPVLVSEIANIARCSRVTRLKVAYLAEPGEAVAQIAKLAALTKLEIANSHLNDDCFHELARLKQLQTLDLWRTRLQNPDFVPLQRLTALNYLVMKSVAVSDAQLDQLANIKSLKRIAASGEEVTALGFRSLRRLKDLYWVELPSSQVSGDGIRHLSQLPNLLRLDISGSDVCDEDIPYISQMARLDRLNVKTTRLTAAGIDTLRNELANCQIVADDAQ